MYEQVEKTKKNKSRAAANSTAQMKDHRKQGLGFVDNRPGVVQNKINLSNKTLSSSVWDSVEKSNLGKELINKITKEKNTAHIDSNNTGPYYAEPISKDVRSKIIGDVNVVIPENAKHEAQNRKFGYEKEDGNTQDKDRAGVVAFHELGHGLHLLKNEVKSGHEHDIFHVVTVKGEKTIEERIPLEEVLNVGFRDNEGLGIVHTYFKSVYRSKLGKDVPDEDEEITKTVVQDIGKRKYKENDYRDSLGKSTRVGYLTKSGK